MNKLGNIKEIIEELNKGEYLTTDGSNIFFLKNNMIRIKSQNANYYLEIEDFIKLYKNVVFYLYNNDILIDENKDEEYYRFYKK